MTKLFLLCAIAALSPIGGSVAAENSEIGRYQAVVTEAGGMGKVTEVLILDTKDGHLWRYWEAPTVVSPGSEGIKYITQLRPGTKPGEVIWSQVVK